MAKVFRLHKGANIITDWGISAAYGSNVINQIADPNGANANKKITSIPSPFAMIDLAKTAFRNVNDSKVLNGTSIYHKIVSDCLDVAEIFFNKDKYKDKIQIISWDVNNDLNTLLNSGNPAHKTVGETLQMYLEQDSTSYNFDKISRLYMLQYIGPKAGMMDIIGATSPATLFFSSANDLSVVSQNITFPNGGKPFDAIYGPLFSRDPNLVKYMFWLQKFYTYTDAKGIEYGFANLFPEVDSYITLNFTNLEENIKDEILNLQQIDINKFTPLSVDGTGGNIIEIFGEQLYGAGKVAIKSDFEIVPTKPKEGIKPLVLPFGTFTKKLIYNQAHFDYSDANVPRADARSLSERTLPGDGTQYPYLTIGDFLEDKIIHISEKMDSDGFFNGNYDKPEKDSYLLPVKDLFFDYFTVDDLMGKMPDGKPMFEMKNMAGGTVEVFLRIPIKKQTQYIEYKRLYTAKGSADDSENDVIEESDFDFALFPNIKFTNDSDAYYRIGLITKPSDTVKYSVQCVCGGQDLKQTEVVRNTNYKTYNKCQTYVIEQSNIDYCYVTRGTVKGLIIPKFKKQGGTDQYTFAIDFGTTNTHIEYSVNGSTSQPFDITQNESQIRLLTKEDQTYTYIYDFDFLPETVGGESEFKFPMRTALSEAKNTEWAAALPMAHANIPFPYEKRREYDYNTIVTGLKWSNDENAIKRVRCYIESLFLILRNKVILNNGDLSKTQIIWFYPISMTHSRYNLFAAEWTKATKKYFGPGATTIPITESIAPYKFYKESGQAVNNIVTIDIGGGTSDIVIANGDDIKCITSFRFAANSIFGDAGANPTGAIQNGIVRQFKDGILNSTKGNEIIGADINGIYEKINKKNVSSDIASFLFVLKDSKSIKEKGLADSADFDAKLRVDETQKIVFVFFYAAIIYHLAHIMKAKQLPMPRHIAFSGNGSKVINILSSATDVLEDYAKIIFMHVYDVKVYDEDGLTIILNSENPKEATCKGGISDPNAKKFVDVAKLKVVLKSTDNKSFVESEQYKDINNKDYINKTVKTVKDFIQFVLDLDSKKEFSYKDNFGVDNASLAIAKKQCLNDILSFAQRGLGQKLKEVADEDVIEETLFFYPINGMLHELSAAICDHQKTS